MQSEQNEKYSVFKREDLVAILRTASVSYSTITQILSTYEVPDAVVIRRQDSFAPPALDAYANGIQAVIETYKSLEKVIWGNEEPLPEFTAVLDNLQSKADYFHSQAALAWSADRKLPD